LYQKLQDGHPENEIIHIHSHAIANPFYFLEDVPVCGHGLRPCPQATFSLLEIVKSYLSCTKKGMIGHLASIAASRGSIVPGC
jgi:hypothetical protein